MLEIAEKKVRISGPKGEATLEADSVIDARMMPDRVWSKAASGISKKIFFIGDAKKPRRILNAIHDGYRVGMEL
jgi:hypothetical protein